MRQRIKLIFTFFVISGCMVLLEGCADVAMSGAQVVYNHHSIEKTLNDQYITLKVNRALDRQDFKGANITATAFNGIVLLAGQVPRPWQRLKAEQLTREVVDVDEVHNLINISNPSSTLTRMSDALITAKVKSKLIASADVDATQVKVVTENGTVYLMGILKPSEAQAAVDVASDTSGVVKVVKIFWYMKLSKTLA